MTFLPPILDPDKIICIGLNYLSHILEGGREPPKQPTIFTRWANTQVGHGQPMIAPNVSHDVRFRGRDGGDHRQALPPRHARRTRSTTSPGYSCYNDGSIREWQRHTSQFTPGKNFPGTGGFGPWIVTPDEIGDISKQIADRRG